MPDNAQLELVTITIDGTALRVPKGTLLVEAAKQINREIPVYCYHSKMGPAGLCRVCLVEIEGIPKLQIGCNTPATDGMIVHTQSEKAADGRRAVLELYLKNHPLDCPICDKGGECDLQDYTMAYGQGHSRSADPKMTKPKAVDLGPTIVLDEERCVVCQRCVRFDDIIVGERQLVLKDRGVHDMIATATGVEYHHDFTGNVTELCPVGALTSKTYRFKARPWDLRRTTTTCTQCSVGCQMHVDVRVGKIMRTMSVQKDDAISDTWLCDRGRYNVGFYDDPRRLTQPLYKREGEWVQIGWENALALWAAAIDEAVRANPRSAGVIGGGRLTNEEAYLLRHVFAGKGVTNLDWRAGRQRQGSPGRSGGKLLDLERVDAIVLLGESGAQRAPVMDLRVRKAAVQKRIPLIRVGSCERAYPAAIPSHDVATVAAAVASLPKGARRVAVIWDGEDLDLGRSLLRELPGEIELFTYVTGEQPNTRGAEAMGMLPAAGGLDTSAMLAAARDGRLAALSILGANPVLHYPDAGFARAAIAAVPFVVVSDLFMTQTAQLATLVLPAKASFEKTGTTTNLAGDLLPVNSAASLDAPPGALSDLEMIIGLAERLDVALPSADEVDAAVISALAAAPTFTLGDMRYSRTCVDPGGAQAEPAEGLKLVLQTGIFAGGGTSAYDDRLTELRPLPSAAICAADAERLNALTGDYTDIECDGFTMHDVLVEVRTGMPQGVVAVIDGLPDDPANLFRESARVCLVNVRKPGTKS